MEKSLKLKIFIEPWNEGPDGIEADITLYKDDIEKCCEYAEMNPNGTIDRDGFMEFVYEMIDNAIEVDGIAPNEYNHNYSWDFATFEEVKRFDEFLEPIIKEYETEFRKQELENFEDGMEFVETKIVDGIEYAYYRVPTEDIFDQTEKGFYPLTATLKYDKIVL